jgi:uncharacterized protein
MAAITPETVYDTSQTVPPPDLDLVAVETEERGFLYRIFLWMSGALLLSAIATEFAPDILNWIAAAKGLLWSGWIMLGGLMVFAAVVAGSVEHMPGPVAVAALAGFAFANGMLFDVVFRNVTGESFQAVYCTGALLFFVMWIHGKVTRGDPSSPRSLLMYCAGGILAALAVNSFLSSSRAIYVASAVVCTLFIVLFWSNADFLRDLKFEFEDAPPEQKAASVGALLLYLDLVIIFVTIFQIRWLRLNPVKPGQEDS